jgi:hypothetical protein
MYGWVYIHTDTHVAEDRPEHLGIIRDINAF